MKGREERRKKTSNVEKEWAWQKKMNWEKEEIAWRIRQKKSDRETDKERDRNSNRNYKNTEKHTNRDIH